MPSTENQGSSSPFASFGRSIWGQKRDQVHSMDSNHRTGAMEAELDSFQERVTEQFEDLASVSAEELLSIEWIRKLLDGLVSCQEEFRVILLNHKAQLSKPPLDRLTSEFFERSVKGLDICNAIRDGIEKIRLWHKHLEIVLCALSSNQRAIGGGQFRRARKALMDLALAMLEEKDHGSVFSHRNRSFGNNNTKKDQTRSPKHSRSLSWSVSRSWSAAKQLQSIASNLSPPRANEIAATNGLANTVFTMSSALMFVLWALVAAIPCQDGGLNINFAIPSPRQFSWAGPFLSLQERIMEESKKRDKHNSNGLLKEIYQIEKWTRTMTDIVDMVQFPLTGERKTEVEQAVLELGLVCRSFKNGLDPLERQVREVFCKIMKCRTDATEFLERGD